MLRGQRERSEESKNNLSHPRSSNSSLSKFLYSPPPPPSPSSTIYNQLDAFYDGVDGSRCRLVNSFFLSSLFCGWLANASNSIFRGSSPRRSAMRICSSHCSLSRGAASRGEVREGADRLETRRVTSIITTVVRSREMFLRGENRDTRNSWGSSSLWGSCEPACCDSPSAEKQMIFVSSICESRDWDRYRWVHSLHIHFVYV